MKILPDPHGVWSQYGTVHHADNCWCYLDEGHAHTAGNICLIDDVHVDESIVPAACVKEHLYSFGLLSKEPERLQDGTWVLGLQVWGEDNSLYWRRENKIPDMSHVITWRNVFSLCMGGWLHVAMTFIKWRASDVTAGWDDKTDNTPLNTMIKEVLIRVHKEDPARPSP